MIIIRKKHPTAQCALFISTGIHLFPKVVDIHIQVLCRTNSTSAETNYVLFPRSKTVCYSMLLLQNTQCQSNVSLCYGNHLTCRGKSSVCFWKQFNKLRRQTSAKKFDSDKQTTFSNPFCKNEYVFIYKRSNSWIFRTLFLDVFWISKPSIKTCLFVPPKGSLNAYSTHPPAFSFEVSLHMSGSLTSAARASAWRCEKGKGTCTGLWPFKSTA